MRHLLPALLIPAALCLAPATTAAQQPPPGLVTRTIALDASPDRYPQLEEALREHLRFHQTNNDPWAWHTWQVANGADLGRYYLRTHGHSWEDLDRQAGLRRSDWADFLANVAPNLRSMSSRITVLEPTLSSWPAEVARPPMVAITRFELTFDGTRSFREALERIHAAARDRAPDRHYAWTTTVNGSNGPEMTLLVPLAGWSELAPSQPPLWTLIEEVYGAEQARALRESIAGSIRSISSAILVHRPDLSYEPADTMAAE